MDLLDGSGQTRTVPSISAISGFYGEPSVDLRENLFGYGPIPGYLDEVLDLCAKYDARLVLSRTGKKIFTGTSNDEAVLVKLKELIKKHYGCTILLEKQHLQHAQPRYLLLC
jgi:hypothetical protein